MYLMMGSQLIEANQSATQPTSNATRDVPSFIVDLISIPRSIHDIQTKFDAILDNNCTERSEVGINAQEGKKAERKKYRRGRHVTITNSRQQTFATSANATT